MDADGNDPFHYHLQATGSTPGCWIVLTSNIKSLHNSGQYDMTKLQMSAQFQPPNFWFCPNILRSWGKTYISKCPINAIYLWSTLFSHIILGVSIRIYIYIALYSNTVVNIILNHGQPSDFVPWDFMASILRSVMLSERALRNSDSE